MPTNWGEWFVEKISSMEERLGYVLELRRVRELWLQGELYLLSTDEQCIDVNKRGIVSDGEVDFTGSSPSMIAELKICGRTYNKKMLNGFSLTDNLASKNLFSIADMLSHHKTEGSIFKDFHRLCAADSAYEKYMIIVIPKLGQQDQLGYLLETATFPGKEYSRKLKWFDIRVFHLPK